jgi:hypothetical protein
LGLGCLQNLLSNTHAEEPKVAETYFLTKWSVS